MSDPGELMQGPGQSGRYGEFGGRYVPESLVPACQELEAAFDSAWADPAFRSRLDDLLADFAGRPTPVTECTRLSERLGIRLLLKREDLAHTGSHKINNVLGQALLAERMENAGSSWRPEPVNMALPPPPPLPFWGSNAWSIWAPLTSSARRSTSSGWSCSAHRCAPSNRGAGHSKTP